MGVCTKSICEPNWIVLKFTSDGHFLSSKCVFIIGLKGHDYTIASISWVGLKSKNWQPTLHLTLESCTRARTKLSTALRECDCDVAVPCALIESQYGPLILLPWTLCCKQTEYTCLHGKAICLWCHGSPNPTWAWLIITHELTGPKQVHLCDTAVCTVTEYPHVREGNWVLREWLISCGKDAYLMKWVRNSDLISA